MPNDPFSNARAYFDVSFPSSGDGFNISKFRNSLAGLGFMDFIPLQPRAHNPADNKIMVRGQDASSFFNPVYYGDGNQRVPFSSGDSPTISAPISNPRIDIVFLTPSGDVRVTTGTEAASPTLPTLAPSGDSRFPICAIYTRVGQTKIVNFEDKDSNPNDGYIYKDLRPWMRTPGAGSSVVGNTNPVNPTGDAQQSPGIATTAARSDHVHGGVHAVRVAGQTNIQGDVELAATSGVLTQSGNRITIPTPFSKVFRSSAQVITSAGQLVLAHGLGATPASIQLQLQCIAAGGEGGYSFGDIFWVPSGLGGEVNNRGVSLVPDATNITIRFGSDAAAFGTINKTTGAYNSLTNTNWRLLVSAFV